MGTADMNRGLLWGQLLAHLDGASRLLELAYHQSHLLPEPERAALRAAYEQVAGLKQRGHEAQTRETKARGRKR